MAQTAVEWFFDNLKNHEIQAEHFELYQQAKAMEKEQLKKAYYTDAVSRPLGVFTSLTPVLKTFENYYKETYNNGL
jgi:hypothetical protein